MHYANKSLNVDVLVQQLRSMHATVDFTTNPGLPAEATPTVHRRLPGHTLPEDFLNFLQNSDGLKLSYNLPQGRPDQRSIAVGSFEVRQVVVLGLLRADD